MAVTNPSHHPQNAPVTFKPHYDREDCIKLDQMIAWALLLTGVVFSYRCPTFLLGSWDDVETYINFHEQIEQQVLSHHAIAEVFSKN